MSDAALPIEVPSALGDRIEAQTLELRAHLSREGRPEACETGFIEGLRRVLACSPFVGGYLARDPARLSALLENGGLQRSYTSEDYHRLLAAALADVRDAASLARALRRFRNRELVRIAWRDIAGVAGLEETMLDLSRLADTAIEQSLGWLHRRQCQDLGVPSDAAGEAQSLCVIAMGKLGAEELNFSSDIDLIFAYPREGQTCGGPRTVSNQEYFNRLGQALIKALGEVTEEGLVFRVDMRLRPFGDSGPLVMSFDALESYYTTHGRDWERYAMVKARPAAGGAGRRLIARLKPFVFRRYLDFTAIESLREMKRLIDCEVRRKGMVDDIKLGPGGIREIEFIAQSFQLVRGGRRPILQERRILQVLEHLRGLAYLPEQAAVELAAAYRFLRTTEHRLQQIDDQQTHSLPEADPDRTRVALGMGFDAWEGFQSALERHRERVQHHFNQLLIKTSGYRAPTPMAETGSWPGVGDVAETERWLERVGFADPKPSLRMIEALYRGMRRLRPTERMRVERVLPTLLGAAGEMAEPGVTVERMLRIIEAIAQRSVYLLLLEEHPGALQQMVRLCAASPWITARIAQHPILLDELLDPRTLYAPPAPEPLETALRSQLAQLAPGDLEHEMEVLRHFKHAQVLRVAAADVAGALAVRRVSDHLSAIADVTLRAALRLAREDLDSRHGTPLVTHDGTRRPAGFCIIAYGKLGGYELGYGSDLDLVFLHDSAAQGPEAPSNQEYFSRLGQRVIHFLSTATPGGRAYEVDTRLRPNGSSGLLVASIDAFADYQKHHAWTWEHQALVRARPVAGDDDLMDGFARIRRRVLGRARVPEVLRREVGEMRARMRRELSRDRSDCFDLKHGRGGMTDIEFMVQYAVLRWAAEHPALLEHTASVRLLEVLSRSGAWAGADCAALSEAYFGYRARAHALALQERPALVTDGEFDRHRERVWEIWCRVIGE